MPTQSQLLNKFAAELAYNADNYCRSRLFHNTIHDEVRYVENLVVYTDHVWKMHNFIHYHISTLSQSMERLFGCDTMLIVRLPRGIKICLIESKWPRILQPNYHWDSIQQKSKISHFSDQLDRQSNWTNYAAIWEMFIVEKQPGVFHKGYDSYGSTFVEHEDVFYYDLSIRNQSVIWTTDDLNDLLINHANKKNKNIRKMIERICACKDGLLLREDASGFVNIISNDRDNTTRIPSNIEIENDLFLDFMRDVGLSHLSILPLDDEENMEEQIRNLKKNLRY